jgi:hypothetical protein
MKPAFYKIIETWISLLPNEFNVLSYVDNLDGTHTIEVCNPLWATFSCVETIHNNGNGYIVKSIAENGDNFDIIVEGSFAIDLNVPTTLDKPYFYHGTLSAVKSELKEKPDMWDKLPMIYLYEVIRESFNVRSQIERTADIRLFLLSEANVNEWTTDCHYVNVINPMTNLGHLMIETLKDNPYFGYPEEYDLTYHANFGRYNNKGHDEKIFSEDVSGCELSLAINILLGLVLCSDCN